jgi:putative nucleotidyltransferase with HDIG domain
MKLYNWDDAGRTATATPTAATAGAKGGQAFSSAPRLWDGVRALPTLPSSLFRFLGLTGDPDRSMDEIADFVCQDPALLARVLPLTAGCFTSPDPAGPTLRDTIRSFGRERIRALANITPLIRSFEPASSGSYATLLWERSVSAATAAQTAATYLQLEQPERYHVAGLLHDIGYLVMLHKAPAQFAELTRRWAQRPAGLLELEREIFGEDHCEIGAQVARQLNIHAWYLPAIENHHTPQPDAGQVSTIVAAAAAFCDWQGLELFARQVIAPTAFSAGFKLREARTREMHEILRGLFPQLKELERHRLLDMIAATVRPVRDGFHSNGVERYGMGEAAWLRPYRYSRSEPVAAVA